MAVDQASSSIQISCSFVNMLVANHPLPVPFQLLLGVGGLAIFYGNNVGRGSQGAAFTVLKKRNCFVGYMAKRIVN